MLATSPRTRNNALRQHVGRARLPLRLSHRRCCTVRTTCLVAGSTSERMHSLRQSPAPLHQYFPFPFLSFFPFSISAGQQNRLQPTSVAPSGSEHSLGSSTSAVSVSNGHGSGSHGPGSQQTLVTVLPSISHSTSTGTNSSSAGPVWHSPFALGGPARAAEVEREDDFQKKGLRPCTLARCRGPGEDCVTCASHDTHQTYDSHH